MIFRARTIVAAVLIATSLVSVAVVVTFNYTSAVELLNDTARAQLVSIANEGMSRIEVEIGELNAGAVSLAEDLGVRAAFADLRQGYDELANQPSMPRVDTEPLLEGIDLGMLSPEEEDELLEFYEAEIRRATPPGFDATPLVELVPGSADSQYLQYHYLVRNRFSEELRSELVDAGDGSTYSAAHARHHPILRELVQTQSGANDLLLIDTENERVIYSTDKAIDFGTDLRIGPHSDTPLARVVVDELRSVAAGEAVFVDFDLYAPAGGAPTAFSVAPIRDDTGIVGAVAVEFASDQFDNITTADGQWEATGLGETGEVYVVGSDRLMRSDSRFSIEDPDEYRRRLSDAGYGPAVGDAVAAFGTTVMIQSVDTDAVELAATGDDFVGVTRNYLDQETLTVAAPLDLPGLNWVVVTELTTAEAYEPLRDYLRRVLIATAFLVPLVAIVGAYVASRVLRPLERVLSVAQKVGEGNLNVELPDASNDEFGELGRRFNDLVADLRDREAALARADAETTELLSAVLPERLVEQVKQGDSNVAESVHSATIMAVSVEGLADDASVDAEMLRDLGVELSARLAEVAAEHEVEPIHSASSQQLFAAGLGTSELEVSSALAFMAAARAAVSEFAEDHNVPLEITAGIAAGHVMAGLIGTGRLAYDVWGEPPRRAIALDAIAQTGQVLVDSAVADTVGDGWLLDRVPNLLNLSGESVPVWEFGEVSSGTDPTGGEDEVALSSFTKAEEGP